MLFTTNWNYPNFFGYIKFEQTIGLCPFFSTMKRTFSIFYDPFYTAWSIFQSYFQTTTITSTNNNFETSKISRNSFKFRIILFYFVTQVLHKSLHKTTEHKGIIWHLISLLFCSYVIDGFLTWNKIEKL